MIDAREIERAKEAATAWLARAGMPHDCGCTDCTSARVLLALIEEREVDISVRWALNAAREEAAEKRGWRAGLLELAEWLETSRGGLDPLPEPRAYYEGQRDVLGNVASRARAMVSEQPRTPSRMDDPDE